MRIEKERIGRAAADLIAGGEAVILDSGSICLQIARCAHGKSFTAVTLDLPAAMELADDPKVGRIVPWRPRWPARSAGRGSG